MSGPAATRRIGARRVDARLGLQAARLYEEFGAAGGADRDFSAIVAAIRERSGPPQEGTS